ncbi:MAG: hypothetical protein N2202_09505 [Proteobacteria bacterium]|nr:hypothetical protein [Pseudomonadota bacterium]
MKKIFIVSILIVSFNSFLFAEEHIIDKQKKIIKKEEELKKEEERLTILSKEIDEKIRKYNEILNKIEKINTEIQDTYNKMEKIRNENVSHLVKIYEAMPPESAAKKIAQFDDETASMIIIKMKPKVVSNIFAHLDPVKSASITNFLIKIEKKIPTK